jgi:hypothetical protein
VPDETLSGELQKFIAEHIESLEKLEVLLLLQKAPDAIWSVQDVYQAIQSSHLSVGRGLRELTAHGFLQQVGKDTFQYRPKTPEVAGQVDLLRTEYQTRRIRVIEGIFSKSAEEMRQFAEAFRIRKEKE